MWVLDALGGSWAQVKNGTDSHGESKGLLITGEPSQDTLLVLLKGLFCLKATGLNCSGLWIANSLWLT